MMSRPQEEVPVSEDRPQQSPGRRRSVAELAREQGVRPVSSVLDLAQDDGFGSDAEVDEFIAFVRAVRHADPA
jgi:hypothetical protein